MREIPLRRAVGCVLASSEKGSTAHGPRGMGAGGWGRRDR